MNGPALSRRCWRGALSLFAAVLVVGCSTLPDPDTGTRPGMGLVVGTITYDGSMGLYGVDVMSMKTGRPQRFRVGASMWPPLVPLFDDDLKRRGGTFAAELPPGRYVVTDWSIRRGQRIHGSTDAIDIPFEVHPGRTTYLGNFHFDEDGKLALQDGAARDIPVLRARLPAMAEKCVAVRIRPGARIADVGAAPTSEAGKTAIEVVACEGKR